MRNQLLALLILRGAMAAATVAPEGTTRVRVWVPVPPQEIGHVELENERLRVIQVEPPQWAATVVVLHTPGVSGALYEELSAWMDLPGPRATPGLEIWSRGGSRETVHTTQFDSGWRAFPWPAGRGTGTYFYSLEQFLEQLSHRFAGRGPVRVFSLAQSFQIAHCLRKDRKNGRRGVTTTLDEMLPALTDAGLTLFPVSDPELPMINEDDTRLFGTGQWFVKPARGMAIASAWQQSEAGAMLTLEVPRRKYTKRGDLPLLRVYGRGAVNVVFERPLVAGADPSDSAAALRTLEAKAMRVTLPWKMESASLRPAAGVPNGMDVCMKSPRWEALPQAEARVDIEIRPLTASKMLLPRLNGLRATRAGGQLCAGPLPFLKNVDLIITAPAEEWVTSLRLAAAER